MKDVHDCAESKRLGAARSRRDYAFHAAFVSSLFSLSLSLSITRVSLCNVCALDSPAALRGVLFAGLPDTAGSIPG